MSKAEVCSRLGVSQSTLRRMIKAGVFPEAIPAETGTSADGKIKWGTNCRWPETDVTEYQRQRIASRNQSTSGVSESARVAA